MIEIISPGQTNRERDLTAKREDYAQAGIPEYWIVDPQEKSVTVLSLEKATYVTHGRFPFGTTATSPQLPTFQINVAELFESTQPLP